MAFAKRPASLRALVSLLSLCWMVSLQGCNSPNANVLTQHNDSSRTGAYLAETSFTPSQVRNRGMHVRYWLAPSYVDPNDFQDKPKETLDGGVVAQLLYLHHVAFPNGFANGLFAATTSDKVYAFDADTGVRQWVTDLMQLDSGPCRIAKGVEATPAIDLGRQRIFVTFATQYGGQDCGLFTGSRVAFFLAALDIDNGAIKASTRLKPANSFHDGVPPPFTEQFYSVHPGLLLDHNSLYLAFGSNAGMEGKGEGFRGWIMRFNPDTLAVQNVFCTSPSAVGAGVWQGGGGLNADPNGNIFFVTGNGVADFDQHFDGNRVFKNNLFGDSFVKLTLSHGKLVPTAWAPSDAAQLNSRDADLGSGGAVLVPGANRIIGGGKTGVMYVLDQTSMSPLQQFNASTNHYHPWVRDTWDGGPHLHGAPTYWRGPDPIYGYVYVWGEKDVLRMYRFDTRAGKFEERRISPVTTAAEVPVHKTGSIQALPDTMPGGMVSLSADGNKRNTGIVWATLPVARCMPALEPCRKKEDIDMDIFGPFPEAIYAFDAETLSLLWNDDLRRWEQPKPNWFSQTAHWAPPTIADGKLFVPTGSGMIVVYELCSDTMPCAGTSKAIEPETPRCEDCHNIDNRGKVLSTFVQPLRARYPNEGAINAWARIASLGIEPPAGHKKDLMFSATGSEIYEARETPGQQTGLSWQLQDTIADLQEIRWAQPVERAAPTLSIHISSGGTWVASDGSQALAEIKTTAAAPEQGGKNTDAPWILFSLAKSAGAGVLSAQTGAQSLYTRGGAPPSHLPARRGEIARVPYRSTFWLYR